MLWRTKSHHSQASEQDATLSPAASAPKNDPAASATQATGTAWLAGHLNHLTPEQEEKLVEFKQVCTERGYYTPAVEPVEGLEAKPASHDDATMLYVPLLDTSGVGKYFPSEFLLNESPKTVSARPQV